MWMGSDGIRACFKPHGNGGSALLATVKGIVAQSSSPKITVSAYVEGEKIFVLRT
jgi:hypothetical protein